MALDDTKTLAERILRLEQKLQRLEKREGRPPVELFDNSAIRNRKIIDDLLVHNHTHANLLGLDADDHTQYTTHPESSTDNAIARWDGTGGRTLQNSSVAIDDNGKLSGDGLDGWIYDTDTWSYVSATSFKITGKDVRYRFPNGTKIKLVQSGSTKYFYVTATAYSTDTTITITGGSDYSLDDAAISGQAYSYAAAPQNFPQWFNYTPTCYGWTSGTVTGTFKYSVIGNIVFLLIDMTAGTSNATYANIDLPVNADRNASYGGTLGLAMDNGTDLTQAARWYIGGSKQEIAFYTNMAKGAWTASGTKRVRVLAIYAKGT